MFDATIDRSYLRPKKSAVLQEWQEHPFIKRASLEIWSGKDATILPLKKFPQDTLLFGRAGVVDASGGYVELSSIPRRVQSSYPVSDPEYRDEQVIYCGYWVQQWGHFLIESIARLWYAFESTEKLIFVTDYGCENQFHGNYKEFLQLLGVWDRIEIINKPTRFKKVTVPQLGYKWREHFSDQYKSIFNRIADSVTISDSHPTADKVFLSRSHLKNIDRTEFGYDMLDDYFSRNGFLVVHPQDISLSELIYLLRHCSECAAVSGTLPHNMLFAADHSKLIIIERNVLNNEIQLDINKIKSLDVTYVDANLAVYPVNVSYGPFIVAYTQQLESFTKQKGFLPPQPCYLTKRYYKKAFITYMKAYRDHYRYQWFMTSWMIGYSDYLYEAYTDSMQYLGEYVYGRKPFKIHHHFMPHYWKQLAKRLLKR